MAQPSSMLPPKSRWWSEKEELELLTAVLEIAREPPESYDPSVNLFDRIAKTLRRSVTNKEILAKIKDLRARCETKYRFIRGFCPARRTAVYQMGFKIWGDEMIREYDKAQKAALCPKIADDNESHQEVKGENRQASPSRPDLKRARQPTKEEENDSGRQKNANGSGEPLGKRRSTHNQEGCFNCGNPGHFAGNCPEENRVVKVSTKQQEQEQIPNSLQVDSKNGHDEQSTSSMSASTVDFEDDNEDCQEFEVENQKTVKRYCATSVVDKITHEAPISELNQGHEQIKEKDDEGSKNQDVNWPLWKKKSRSRRRRRSRRSRRRAHLGSKISEHFPRACPEEKTMENSTKEQTQGGISGDIIGLQLESKNKHEQLSESVSASCEIGSHPLKSLESEQKMEVCNNLKAQHSEQTKDVSNSSNLRTQQTEKTIEFSSKLETGSHQPKSQKPVQRESVLHNSKNDSSQLSSKKKESNISKSQHSTSRSTCKNKGFKRFEVGLHQPPSSHHWSRGPPPSTLGPLVPFVPYGPLLTPLYRCPPPPQSYRYLPLSYRYPYPIVDTKR